MKRILLVSFMLLLGVGYGICSANGFAVPQVMTTKWNGQMASPKRRTQSQATNGTPDETSPLIEPGKSVGPLRLGDTESRFLEIFPDRPNLPVDRQTFNPDCGVQLHWVDLDPLSLGVIALSHERIITQIEVGTPRFRTVAGITWGSSPSEIKEHYPGLKAYEAIGTTSEAVGGRNLIFWISRDKGLGFVLAYSRAISDWVLYKIIVFPPGGRFCREGEIPDATNWQELAPYSLATPDKSASLN
jgi:hypothetical protein